VWAKSDIAVLMSEFEGTSISMLEAMAQGCVPVVTRVSGTRQAILDGLTGLTTSIGDFESMASGIAALALDRAQVESMGRAAHSHMRDHFGLDAYTAWLADLVDEAWSKAPRHTPFRFDLIRPRYGASPSEPLPYVRYSLKRFIGKVRKRIGY
jgi:glycosyltransferase involved in cell wall biosynthesis